MPDRLPPVPANGSSADAVPTGYLDALRAPRGVWSLGAVLLVISLLALAGGFLYAIGGPPSPYVQVFYLPILLAAVFWRGPGGALTGLVAGIIVMLIPQSPEPVVDEIARLAFFGGVGAFVGTAQGLLERRLVHGEELLRRIGVVHARTLSTFASTIDLRDKPTGGHSSRVAHNARALAKALDVDQETVRAAYWSGLLHDLGKIAVPERILQKPAALTREEMEMMRRHSTVGADLLLSVDGDMQPIAEGIRCHHEWWDGSGYPNRLRGEEIPLVGRIVALVDVFEALTCRRPYRSHPAPAAEVMTYIRNGASSQFDPGLVPAFEELFLQGQIYTSEVPQPPLRVEEPTVVVPEESTPVVIAAPRRLVYQRGSSGRP
jgi:putative nucleotidyltransferase with HDIG domain